MHIILISKPIRGYIGIVLRITHIPKLTTYKRKCLETFAKHIYALCISMPNLGIDIVIRVWWPCCIEDGLSIADLYPGIWGRGGQAWPLLLVQLGFVQRRTWKYTQHKDMLRVLVWEMILYLYMCQVAHYKSQHAQTLLRSRFSIDTYIHQMWKELVKRCGL